MLSTVLKQKLLCSGKRQKIISSGPVAAEALLEVNSKHGGNYMKLTKDQLVALCISRGVSASGNKPELCERLGAPVPLARTHARRLKSCCGMPRGRKTAVWMHERQMSSRFYGKGAAPVHEEWPGCSGIAC